MEPVIIRSIPDSLNSSVWQQYMVFALRNSEIVHFLRVAKVVSGVEISHSVTESVAGLVLKKRNTHMKFPSQDPHAAAVIAIESDEWRDH